MQVNIPYMEHLGDVWMSVGSATQAKKHAGQLGGSVPQIVWWRFQKKMSFKYHLKNIPPLSQTGVANIPSYYYEVVGGLGGFGSLDHVLDWTWFKTN